MMIIASRSTKITSALAYTHSQYMHVICYYIKIKFYANVNFNLRFRFDSLRRLYTAVLYTQPALFSLLYIKCDAIITLSTQARVMIHFFFKLIL